VNVGRYDFKFQSFLIRYSIVERGSANSDDFWGKYQRKLKYLIKCGRMWNVRMINFVVHEVTIEPEEVK